MGSSVIDLFVLIILYLHTHSSVIGLLYANLHEDYIIVSNLSLHGNRAFKEPPGAHHKK